MRTLIPNPQNRVGPAGNNNPGKTRCFAAHLLLLVFGSTFFAPLLSADAVQAGLAVCCKRTGKHFCTGPSGHNASSLKSTDAFPKTPQVCEQCPYAFSPTLTAVVPAPGIIVAAAGNSQRIDIPPAQPYMQPLPFVTTKRADLKRGPPSLVC